MAGNYDDRDGKIWMDGQLIDWREANVHILTHAMHYASSVFEGERAYGGKIFKSREHSERLKRSAEMIDCYVRGLPLEPVIDRKLPTFHLAPVEVDPAEYQRARDLLLGSNNELGAQGMFSVDLYQNWWEAKVKGRAKAPIELRRRKT
mgnify:CR=1 FL=1